MFYRIVMLVLFVFANIDAAWSYWLGDQWLTEGHGLNPMIAFPLAFIAVCVGLSCLKEFICSYETVRKLWAAGQAASDWMYENSGARCHDGSLRTLGMQSELGLNTYLIVRRDRIRTNRS